MTYNKENQMFDFVKTTRVQSETIRLVTRYDEMNAREQNKDGTVVDVPRLNNIPVHTQTKRFAERLAQEFRGCTFGIDKHCKQSWEQNRLVHNEVWLMMPNQPYALARIGYGDFSPSSKGISCFGVYSRTINNEKYKGGSDQYYMAMSTDIERAVKNAKKHIRMFSPVEYAQMTAGEFTNEVEACSSKVGDAWSIARRTARESDHLYKELKHLMESGHRFLSDEFAGMVTNWITTAKEWSIEKNRAVPAYFVHVSVVRDEQMFDIVEVEDAKGKLGNYSQAWADAKSQKFKANDLPEDLMGKLSVLSLLEPGQYTQGVGKRIDDTMFWVERT